jgi:nucleotide-binding universal stress UspA family protein
MARTLGYRSLLVPVADNPESDRALNVACRLATEHGATITALAVVEVSPLLPLDARMDAEEAASKRLLARAQAAGDSYGIGVAPRLVRGRHAGEAIVAAAEKSGADVIVIGAPRRRGAHVFGRTTEVVLKRAPCRVMVVATAAKAVQLTSAPVWAGASSSPSSAALRSSR